MKIEYISIILSILLSFIFIYLLHFSIFNGITSGIIISLLPTLIYEYYESQIDQKLQEEFFSFALDLSQLLKSGLTLPAALEYIKNNDYGLLNPYIERLFARISWGIGVKDSFEILSKEIPSKNVGRTIKTIIEIYESGGSLDVSLDSSVKTLLEIKRLREERKSAIHENILDSFIVFVFFLGIIATFAIFLIPFITQVLPNSSGSNVNISPQFFDQILYGLSIIESIFGGLALGKMYADSYKYGTRFVIIFLLLTLILFDFIIPILPKGSAVINIAGVGNI